jgi:hypothetical protein
MPKPVYGLMYCTMLLAAALVGLVSLVDAQERKPNILAGGMILACTTSGLQPRHHRGAAA